MFGETSVNGRFRRSYQLNIVVIKSSEVCEVFFSYAYFKMDCRLLNSNKRYESENKEGTSSTSGKSVKSVKIENTMTATWTLVLRRHKSMAKRGHNVFCV
jgi:hypothetical protein